MPDPELLVRRAAVSDAAGIARVQVRAWQSAYRGQIPGRILDSLDETTRAARWLESIPQAGHVLHVAVHDDTVIGFCSFIRSRDPDSNDGTGEIAAVYVDPGRWRSGIGRALVEASLDEARTRGYREVTLWVLASNQLGRGFYERLGFAHDGETKMEALQGCELHEVRYRLELPRSGSEG